MGAHVLVGMVAPLLLVAAAPVTLALRTLQVGRARRVSRLLRSWPARFFTAPVVAAVLNVGGMWALYRTPVFQAMQGDPLLHWLVMTHFLLDGYLFTAAIIPTNPAPHRAGYPLRMVVLVASGRHAHVLRGRHRRHRHHHDAVRPVVSHRRACTPTHADQRRLIAQEGAPGSVVKPMMR